MIDYSIFTDPERKIIQYKHWGKIGKEDIGRAWQELLSMPEFTQMKYHLFSDYREAVFNLTVAEAAEIVVFLKTLKDILRGNRQCLVVSDPHSTAVSLLFQNEVNMEVGFVVKVFTSADAAMAWLTAR